MEWIDIKDNPPTKDKSLIKVKNKNREAVAFFGFCKGNEPYFGFEGGVRKFTPTHWMPLPEPPKE